MRKLTLLFTFFSIFTFSQNSQLVIVKRQYEFQKKENEYNINYLMKSLFESCNYEVLFDDDILTKDQAENTCNTLKVNLIDNSGVFKTIVKIQLVDCYNKIIFETPEVFSKEKDYQAAYLETVKKLQPELRKRIIAKPEIIKTAENQSEITPKQMAEISCFAKPITNGFELYLINNKVNNKGVYLLYKTTNPDVFIATMVDGNQINGVVIKKEQQYYFQYYLNNQLITNLLKINFH